MGFADRHGQESGEIAIQTTSGGKMIEGLAVIEATHLHGILDRCTGSIEFDRSIRRPGDGDHAQVDVRRKRLIDLQLLHTSRLALCKSRIVEKGQPDRALDLQGALPEQKDGRGMRIDAADLWMSSWIAQECEYVVLIG